MNNLIPTPIVFPVAGSEDLSEANEDPRHPHEYTMNLVYKFIVLSFVGELAGTNRRE